MGTLHCPACDAQVAFTKHLLPEGLTLTQVQIRGMGDWLDYFDSVIVNPAPRALGWYMNYEGYSRLIDDGCDIYLLNNLSGGVDNLCVDALRMANLARTGQLEKLHAWLEGAEYRVRLIAQTRFQDPLPAPLPEITLRTGAAYAYNFSKEALETFIATAVELHRIGWDVFHGETLNEAWMCNQYPRLLRALDAFAKFVPAKETGQTVARKDLRFGQHFTDRDGKQRVVISPVDNINRIAYLTFTSSWELVEKKESWESASNWAHISAIPPKLKPYELLPDAAKAAVQPFKKSVQMNCSFYERGVQLLRPQWQEQFRTHTEDARTWTGWEDIYRYFKGDSFRMPFLKRPNFRILVAYNGWVSTWKSHGPYFQEELDSKLQEILNTSTAQTELAPGIYTDDEDKISKIEVYEDRARVREIHVLKGFGDV